jgi:hypothetical protein
MARITLWGFYQYDKTLFDDIVLPDGIDKDNLISDIMRNSGDLYPYHQVPEYFKRNINFWFARRLFDFSKMYESLRVEYSPIENYNRLEDTTRNFKDSGKDTETLTLGSSTTSKNTGTDTETLTLGSSTTSKNTGTDMDTMQGGGSTEKGVSAYNEDGYTNREKDTETRNSNSTKQYDSTVTNTGSGSDETKQTYDSTVTNTGSGSDMTQTDYGKQRAETESTRVHGNIGVTTSQQMIESEMSLRATYDIYKIISREFEREFLVQIY